jgi:MraZ protein
VEESVEDSQPTVFKGTYRHRIDTKGRIPVPASFRRALQAEGQGQVVLTLLDQCLAAYPPRQWEALESQLSALPAFRKPVKALTRLLASRATDCELDVQGRILLPAPLRASAQLRQEAVVVGVLTRFEIWSPENWTSFVEESERLLEDVALDVQWPPPLGPGGGPPATAAPSGRPRPQAKPNR